MNLTEKKIRQLIREEIGRTQGIGQKAHSALMQNPILANRDADTVFDEVMRMIGAQEDEGNVVRGVVDRWMKRANKGRRSTPKDGQSARHARTAAARKRLNVPEPKSTEELIRKRLK